MNELPRQKLQEIIARYGFNLCNDIRKCEGLLRDLCGEYRKEISLLISALKEKIPLDLHRSTSTSNNQASKEILIARLVKRLQNNLGLTESAAVWTVDSWAIALGVIDKPSLITSDRDYKSKLEKYELNLFRAIQKEFPISDSIKSFLENNWLFLGLKEEDVKKIDASIISQKETELESQKSQIIALKTKLNELEKQLTIEKSHSSVRGVLALIFGLIFLGTGIFSLFQFEKNNFLEKATNELTIENQDLQKQITDLNQENKELINQIYSYDLEQTTYVKVCNNSISLIDVAYAYQYEQGWRSKGWWNVESGDCSTINLGNYQGKIYLHGTNSQRTWGKDNFSFCVDKNDKFDIENTTFSWLCIGNSEDNYRLAKGTEYLVYPGTKTINLK